MYIHIIILILSALIVIMWHELNKIKISRVSVVVFKSGRHILYILGNAISKELSSEVRKKFFSIIQYWVNVRIPLNLFTNTHTRPCNMGHHICIIDFIILLAHDYINSSNVNNKVYKMAYKNSKFTATSSLKTNFYPKTICTILWNVLFVIL